MRPSPLSPLVFALILASAGVSSADAAKPEELLRLYTSLGLPLPPSGARPVLLDSQWRTADAAGKAIQLVHVALRPASAAGPRAPVLLGTTWHTPADQEPRAILPEPSQVPWSRLRACHGPRFFDTNAALATAIQCQALGLRALAATLLAEALRQPCGHHFSGFFAPANLDGREAVLRLAWAHWGNELTRPGSDRAVIATRMRALLERLKALDTTANRALLRSLELTVAPGPRAAGPVDALIEDLVEVANPAPDAPRAGRDEPQPPQRARVLALGFAAVPALIRHLDDERLTRFVLVGFNNFPPWILRVQHVAGDLLKELSGEELGTDWLRRLQGWPASREAAAAWWKRARATGEEAWLRAHVLPADPKDAWPRRAMLELLAAKYPQRLPEVYRTVLTARPQLQSWPIVAAIVGSRLPPHTKTELLLLGARHADLEHRRAALWELRERAPAQFRQILLATLRLTPVTPTTPYWSCREAAFAHLVIETDDDEAWRVLLATPGAWTWGCGWS
ncbi:MAG TPA: hypothetical protein VGQ83_31900 [Polyangia bacterium]|jgi:hypothetical protein